MRLAPHITGVIVRVLIVALPARRGTLTFWWDLDTLTQFLQVRLTTLLLTHMATASKQMRVQQHNAQLNLQKLVQVYNAEDVIVIVLNVKHLERIL